MKKNILGILGILGIQIYFKKKCVFESYILL